MSKIGRLFGSIGVVLILITLFAGNALALTNDSNGQNDGHVFVLSDDTSTSDTKVTAFSDKGVVIPGDTFTVSFSVYGVADLYGASLDLKFDNSTLELVSETDIQPGDIFASLDPYSDYNITISPVAIDYNSDGGLNIADVNADGVINFVAHLLGGTNGLSYLDDNWHSFVKITFKVKDYNDNSSYFNGREYIPIELLFQDYLPDNFSDPVANNGIAVVKLANSSDDFTSGIATNKISYQGLDAEVLVLPSLSYERVWANPEPASDWFLFRTSIELDSDALNITGGEIRYTLDGSNPIENGIQYNRPIEIEDDTLIKAVAVVNGEYGQVAEFPYQISNIENFWKMGEIVVSEGYGPLTITIPGQHLPVSGYNVYVRIGEPDPTLPYYEESTWLQTWELQNVTLVDENTITATVPAEITVGSYALQVKFVEPDSGDYAGNTSQDWFRVELDVGVSTPVASPEPGTYWFGEDVKLTAAEGAEIWYTLDITKDPKTEGTLYTGPIEVRDDTTIKALALHDGVYSEVTQFNYQISEINFGEMDQIIVPPGYGSFAITILGQHLPTSGYDVYVRIGEPDPTLPYYEESTWLQTWELQDATVVDENTITATVPAAIPIGKYAVQVKFVAFGNDDGPSHISNPGFIVEPEWIEVEPGGVPLGYPNTTIILKEDVEAGQDIWSEGELLEIRLTKDDGLRMGYVTDEVTENQVKFTLLAGTLPQGNYHLELLKGNIPIAQTWFDVYLEPYVSIEVPVPLAEGSDGSGVDIDAIITTQNIDLVGFNPDQDAEVWMYGMYGEFNNYKGTYDAAQSIPSSGKLVFHFSGVEADHYDMAAWIRNGFGEKEVWVDSYDYKPVVYRVQPKVHPAGKKYFGIELQGYNIISLNYDSVVKLVYKDGPNAGEVVATTEGIIDEYWLGISHDSQQMDCLMVNMKAIGDTMPTGVYEIRITDDTGWFDSDIGLRANSVEFTEEPVLMGIDPYLLGVGANDFSIKVQGVNLELLDLANLSVQMEGKDKDENVIWLASADRIEIVDKDGGFGYIRADFFDSDSLPQNEQDFRVTVRNNGDFVREVYELWVRTTIDPVIVGVTPTLVSPGKTSYSLTLYGWNLAELDLAEYTMIEVRQPDGNYLAMNNYTLTLINENEIQFNIDLYDSLSEGYYEISINDTAQGIPWEHIGRVGFEARPSSTDTTPPDLYIVSPLNNSVVNTVYPTISFAAIDNESVVSYVYVSLDEIEWTGLINQNNHTYSLILEEELSEGSHLVYVKVYNEEGLLAEDSWMFTIDLSSTGGIEITKEWLPGGIAGEAYDQEVTIMGGISPYTWSLTTGSLPMGLKLDSVTGRVYGTPTQSGDFIFGVRVTDSGDPVDYDEKVFSLFFEEEITQLTITSTSLPDATKGESYSVTLSATGGTTPYTWTLSGVSNLPEGLTLSEDGVISGTCSQEGTSEVEFVVIVTNDFGNSAQKTLLINVNPGTIDECFIATAAFGSKFTWPVVLLRNFRDNYLLTTAPGRAFVDFYYRNSPPIADFIRGSEGLKLFVKILLLPILAVVFLLDHPVLATISVLLIMFVILKRYRRQSESKFI